MAELSRADFDSCLDFLAGDLASPPGAYEPEPGASPAMVFASDLEAQRLVWRPEPPHYPLVLEQRGDDQLGGDRQVLVMAWRSVPSKVPTPNGSSLAIGSCSMAAVWNSAAVTGSCSTPVREALTRDCRSGTAIASRSRPSWPARSPSSGPRGRGGSPRHGPLALRGWLIEALELAPRVSAVLAELIEAQERLSEVPRVSELLVETFPAESEPGQTYVFHAPLNRAACEALGRATAARLGRRFGRDLSLQAADLGWSVRLPEGAELSSSGTEEPAGARGARGRRTRGAGPGRASRAAVPVHRGHRPDGAAQSRARPQGAGGGNELGEQPALPARQGGLSPAPPAARDPPRSASRLARPADRGPVAPLASCASGSANSHRFPPSPRPGSRRRPMNRSSSSRPPTPSAGSMSD